MFLVIYIAYILMIFSSMIMASVLIHRVRRASASKKQYRELIANEFCKAYQTEQANDNFIYNKSYEFF